ncbi:putative EF-hand domain pair protein [Rosa chinensis]|uniref:Putative EF-hand domain pair protein n=1 Tax=Rosa chinensis TaxID=74649 RepID=A0A2P6Q6Y0_ROSCH|nr:polcalcin Phl p 7-like [Rosa chinensis]PRQ29941.1 putative EF-hand domain pair protein [Rosa chinensis]
MADDADAKAGCERIFKRFDYNGDAKVSLTEFADALQALGTSSPEEVRQRMDEIDMDHDGFISLEELFAFQRANPDLMKEVVKKLSP